tara:strand:+ start:17 stop:475 length:459 start_codon:yes stop_codon:yes gene_type:complete
MNNRIRKVTFGDNVKIIEPCNLYECSLASNVFVGPFVEIQDNVEIGVRSRIQSHSFVCSGTKIGSDVFVGHGVMFINDLFSCGGPAKGNKNLWKFPIIGDNVSLGSNSTILPVKICNKVVVGAGSVVVRDIDVSGIYAGNPAKLIRELPVKK